MEDTNPNNKIKLVLFDFDGVLSKGRFYQTNPEIRNIAEKVLFTKEAWPFMKLWMEGKMKYNEVNQLLAENSDFTQEEIESALVESVKQFKLNEELIEWSKSLKSQGIKTAIFTDNIDIFDIITTPYFELDSIFDEVYSSSKYGKLKLDDDAEFLKYVINEQGMVPENTLFIDDSPKIAEPMENIGGYSYIYNDYDNEFPKFLEWWSNFNN